MPRTPSACSTVRYNARSDRHSFYSLAPFGMFLIAWRTPRSPSTSSATNKDHVSVCASYTRHGEAYLHPEVHRTARSCDTAVKGRGFGMKQVHYSWQTYMLDHTAHTSLRDAAPTKYLHCVAGGILRGACRGHLQQTDRPGEESGLLLVGLWPTKRQRGQPCTRKGRADHVVHLVRDVL